MVFNIQMAIAQAQRKRNREARIRGSQRAAERGLHLASVCPTGYRWADRQKGGRRPSADGGIGKLEIDPVIGPKVHEAFVRRANGESYEKLAAFLGLKGKSSARAVITNRVYLGEARIVGMRKGESIVKPNAHPPLVTVEEWERANAGNASFAPRTGKWSALARLGGIARCAGCGRPLAVGSIRQREPYYSCTVEGCTHRTGIRAADLDAYVGGLCLEAAVREVPEVAAILAGDNRYQRALGLVEKAQLELDTFIETVSVSEIGKDMWIKGKAARKEALDLARKQLKETPPVREAYTGKIPVSAEQWADADLETRREIVEAAMDRDANRRLVERVLVSPVGRGKRVPARERVQVWFHGAAEPYAPAEVAA